MIGTRRIRNWEHFFSEDNLASVFLISYVPNDKNKDRVRKIFKAIKIIINFPIIDVGKYLDQEKESSSNEKKVTTVRFKKDSLKGRNFFSLYKKVERRSKKIIRDPNKGFVKLNFGLGKGKKKFDKRQSIKEKDWNLKKERILKNN